MPGRADLTDTRWARLETLLPRGKKAGRRSGRNGSSSTGSGGTSAQDARGGTFRTGTGRGRRCTDGWEWTERYPAQPEILRCLNFAADRLDVKKHLRFRTRVDSARFGDHTDRWTVTTDSGDGAVTVAKYFVTAVGCLSTSQTISRSWRTSAAQRITRRTAR